jgi:hypothetical protein
MSNNQSPNRWPSLQPTAAPSGLRLCSAFFLASALLVSAATAAAADGGVRASRPTPTHRHGGSIGQMPLGLGGSTGARPEASGGIAGNCGSVSFSQSSSSTIAPQNTAQCFDDSTGELVSAENGLARLFTAPTSLHIRCVEFGIQVNDGATWPVRARVWVGGNVVATSDPVDIPQNSGPALYTASFPDFFAIPAGTDYVVELLVPSRLLSDGGDGGSLFLGSNALGQSGPTFIRAPFCDVNTFTDLAQLGFPNVHLVMTVEADVPVQSLVAFGFEHTASGDIVERKDANGKVTIWHAAAPAAGEVAIELGILPGPMGVTMGGSFATGSPDSTVTWSPIGGFDGLPEGPVGTTRFHTDDGTHGTIQVDYSMLGTAAQTVRLFDADGAPIADFAWGNDMPIGVSAPPVSFGYSCRAYEEIDIKWPVPAQVTLGSVTIGASSMRIAVKAPAFTPSYLSQIILSTDINSSVPATALEISSLSVDQFGWAIAVDNDDTLIDAGVMPGGIVGLNFGGPGPAVIVAKQYDKSTPKLLEKCVAAFEVDIDAPSLDQPGLEFTATVSDSSDFDETPNASSLTLHEIGHFFDVFVDFSGIGSPTYHVEILSNHVHVAAMPGLSGPVGSMSAPPKKIGKLGGQTECFTMCTDSATAFTIDGQVFVGDEIRILAEGGAAAECKDLLTLSATNAPAGVTITGASTSPKLPPWIVKFGNAHGVVGSPIVACDDVLYVWRDLGDSGFNGVSLAVPGVDGASVSFELPSDTPDAVHQVTVSGLHHEIPFDETVTLSVHPNNAMVVALDVAILVASDVRAIRDGQVVLSIPTVLPPVPTAIASLDLTGLDEAVATVHPVWAAKECKDQVSLNAAVPMNFAAIGGGTVLADTVVVVRPTNDPPSMTSVALTGNACTPNSVISHESIDKLGWTFTGLGHALLDATTPGAVAIPCCIGSTGDDGVEIDLGCASFFDIFVVLPDWTEPGTSLTLQGVAGDFAGQEGGGTTGSLTFVRGAFFDVFADFSDIGTDTKHVIVKNAQGIPVFQTVTSDLFVGQLSAAPFKLGKLGGATPCYRACVPNGTQFTFGPVTVDAHEIEVLAVGGTDAQCKSAARLTGTGDLGPISITGVETQAACLGDLDGDGQVAGSDLAILLGAWSTGTVDFNADGTTDAADLAILLGAWGDC